VASVAVPVVDEADRDFFRPVGGRQRGGEDVRRCQQTTNASAYGQVAAILRVRCRAWVVMVAGKCSSR
jgi:hypothetical protein